MLPIPAVLWLALLPSVLSDIAQEPLSREHATNDHILEQVTARPGQPRKLHGRFLHITDIHPDPFYRTYTSSEAEIACHWGHGPAGYYGAETSDCDSPLSLVNATFDWIEHNLKDKIDFIIWTGDSARHDNDEHIPRSTHQVIGQNQFLVRKFEEVFGNDKAGRHFDVPIVPSFGNNDILPHNIFLKGPNEWTKTYADIWRPFIPEEQRHGFDRGGWFYVEVIPNKLAVFSLNTMYFFDANTAVAGCAARSQPGFEHMEWLRIQLQFLRDRGVKAILSGHVPPARNEDKVGWDETCWQKYTLWMQQYRDVVVGSVYGHMNIEHFILQDFKDINIAVAAGVEQSEFSELEADRDDFSTQVKAPDYRMALREIWSKLPSIPDGLSVLRAGYSPSLTSSNEHTVIEKQRKKKKKDRRTDEQKFYDKIGGPFAERFAVSHIAASVVPNFFSTMRVFEYNTTGLEDSALLEESSFPQVPAWPERDAVSPQDGCEWYDPQELVDFLNTLPPETSMRLMAEVPSANVTEYKASKHKKHKKPKRRRPKRPRFTVPEGPSSTAPPGPAYSPQTLSWLGYTQYFANNTYINNDFASFKSPFAPRSSAGRETEGDIDTRGWNPGRHVDERPGDGKKNGKPTPRNFTYEVEYNTQDTKDDYRLGVGLTVRKWVELAARIGEYGGEESKGLEDCKSFGPGGSLMDEIRVVTADDASNEDIRDDLSLEESDDSDDDGKNNDGETALSHKKHKDKTHKKKKKEKKHKKKKKRRKIVNRDWFAFVRRAVTATLNDEELHEQFGEVDVDASDIVEAALAGDSVISFEASRSWKLKHGCGLACTEPPAWLVEMLDFLLQTWTGSVVWIAFVVLSTKRVLQRFWPNGPWHTVRNPKVRGSEKVSET